MSNYMGAILLAFYTCLGWGMITPMVVKMIQHTGPANFHPALPFLWNTFGQVVISSFLLLATDFVPLKSWTWHWSAWVLAFCWPTVSLAIGYAYALVVDRASIPNAVAAVYPALVSAPHSLVFYGRINVAA